MDKPRRKQQQKKNQNRSIRNMMMGKRFTPGPAPSVIITNPWYTRVQSIQTGSDTLEDFNVVTIINSGGYSTSTTNVRFLSIRAWALFDTALNTRAQLTVYNPVSGLILQKLDDYGTASELARVGYEWAASVQSTPVPTDSTNDVFALIGPSIVQIHLLFQAGF